GWVFRVCFLVVGWEVIWGFVETSSIPNAFSAASRIESSTIPTRIVSGRSIMVGEVFLVPADTMVAAVSRNKSRNCLGIATYSFGRNYCWISAASLPNTKNGGPESQRSRRSRISSERSPHRQLERSRTSNAEYARCGSRQANRRGVRVSHDSTHADPGGTAVGDKVWRIEEVDHLTLPAKPD